MWGLFIPFDGAWWLPVRRWGGLGDFAGCGWFAGVAWLVWALFWFGAVGLGILVICLLPMFLVGLV